MTIEILFGEICNLFGDHSTDLAAQVVNLGS